MQYNVNRQGKGVTVALNGQLDFAANETFAVLLKDIGEVDSGMVTFDLSGLTHIDSVGLGLLYIAQEELDRTGSRVALSSAHGPVKRLLELTEASESFEIRP